MLQDDFQAMGDPYLKKTPVREPRNLAGTSIVVSGATFTFNISCMGKIPFFASFINFNKFYQSLMQQTPSFITLGN